MNVGVWTLRKIRNYHALLNKGDNYSRKMVLDLVETVLSDIDAGRLIHDLMYLEGDLLHVGEKTWDISGKRNIYMIGAGKACNTMAQAVCEILGDRLTKGIISVKIPEENDTYCNTEVYVGGHPLPNNESLFAAQQMIALIKQASSEDLFISVISGGSSSLLTSPVEGISLADEIKAQDLLLKSGAGIIEINAVRRHISRSNGGRLAEYVDHKGAQMINLVVGDWVGSPATLGRSSPYPFQGTPVAPDNTTILDARNTLINYRLIDKFPESIVSFLWDDSCVKETPKKFSDRIVTFLLSGLPDVCNLACVAAEKMGIPCMVLSSYIEGESRQAGFLMSSIAREIQEYSRPIAAPCFIVSAGETTTRITGSVTGTGGPSHEFVLGFSLGSRTMKEVAIISIDTEGTDGTTLFAGGIADTKTTKRFEEKQINIFEVLCKHSSCEALGALKDNIFTGNTGTNVCDFNVMFVSEKKDMERE